MSRSGFTTIEMLIVVAIIGIITLIGFPKIRRTLDKTNVRSARTATGTLVATARAAAIQRGCVGVVHFTAAPAMEGRNFDLQVNATDTAGGALRQTTTRAFEVSA